MSRSKAPLDLFHRNDTRKRARARVHTHTTCIASLEIFKAFPRGFIHDIARENARPYLGMVLNKGCGVQPCRQIHDEAVASLPDKFHRDETYGRGSWKANDFHITESGVRVACPFVSVSLRSQP